MAYEESWIKFYSWLCRCYGPYNIPENEFYYWIDYFFKIKEQKTIILEIFIKLGLIEKTEKGLTTIKCDNFSNPTTKKKMKNSLDSILLANSH